MVNEVLNFLRLVQVFYRGVSLLVIDRGSNFGQGRVLTYGQGQTVVV